MCCCWNIVVIKGGIVLLLLQTHHPYASTMLSATRSRAVIFSEYQILALHNGQRSTEATHRRGTQHFGSQERAQRCVRYTFATVRNRSQTHVRLHHLGVLLYRILRRRFTRGATDDMEPDMHFACTMCMKASLTGQILQPWGHEFHGGVSIGGTHPWILWGSLFEALTSLSYAIPNGVRR